MRTDLSSAIIGRSLNEKHNPKSAAVSRGGRRSDRCTLADYLPAVLGDLCKSIRSPIMFNVSRRIASESAVFPLCSPIRSSSGVGEAFASLFAAGNAALLREVFLARHPRSTAR